MTVKEVYDRAKAIMKEKASSTIYDAYLIDDLNRLLIELFNENNIARVFNGKEKLESPQIVPKTSYSSVEIELEFEYAANVLPLGLAARFSIDDDLNKYSIYNTDYNNARVMAQKLVSRKKLEDAS